LSYRHTCNISFFCQYSHVRQIYAETPPWDSDVKPTGDRRMFRGNMKWYTFITGETLAIRKEAIVPLESILFGALPVVALHEFIPTW
jgi:hypothetical protein